MSSKEEIWDGVLGELEVNLSRPNFNTWFKDTFIDSIKDDKKVVIGVPNTFTLEWLQNKYAEEIKKALKKFLPNIASLEFHVSHADKFFVKETSGQKEEQEISHFEIPKPQTLQKTKNINSYFTFENFIVGDSNKFAHAAALAVAKNPGKNYNPLFIYGGVGLGKTHLIQAVAWEIKKQSPHQKILYLSFEEFANDFIGMVKRGKMDDFKKKYREIDVLLIDDIQFISGKERTQDEFFHTFNTLHQSQKQIILTSDRPPKSIPLLEERLRSRFEWGMIVDVAAPDLETRIAILKHKLEEKNLVINDEILDFIAHQIQHNIRELEGALNKIEAYLSLTGEELNLNQVKKMLESLIKSKKNIDPKKILTTVCEYYQVEKKDLLGQKREQKITLPRQIVMYFLRYEFNFSFPKIAEFLNRKDHTTIIYGCGKIEKELTNNSLLKRDLDAIKQRLVVY
ncbi:MAG: chromosomal replication initiator protein DnaA [Patescibacteria group bacterium]|nr:chromosomal replication initiator protein DnaA [Patescibacteria group bacterium]